MPFKSKNLFSKKSSGVLSASQDLNITQPEASSTQAQEPSFVPVETPYASSVAFEPQAPTRAASAFDEHGSAPFDGAHTSVTQACLATQLSCLRLPGPPCTLPCSSMQDLLTDSYSRHFHSCHFYL